MAHGFPEQSISHFMETEVATLPSNAIIDKAIGISALFSLFSPLSLSLSLFVLFLSRLFPFLPPLSFVPLSANANTELVLRKHQRIVPIIHEEGEDERVIGVVSRAD